LNVGNYSGKVTLTFFQQPYQRTYSWEDYYRTDVPSPSKNSIFHTVTFEVRENTKVSVPEVMFVESSLFSMKPYFFEIPQCFLSKKVQIPSNAQIPSDLQTPSVVNENTPLVNPFLMPTEPVPSTSETPEQTKVEEKAPENTVIGSSKEENEFCMKIMQNVSQCISTNPKFGDLHWVSFANGPSSIKISDIQKWSLIPTLNQFSTQRFPIDSIFQELNIPISHNLKIFNSGFHISGKFTYYLRPIIAVYNMNDGKRCTKIEDEINETKDCFSVDYKTICGCSFECQINFSIDLDLDKIGTDKFIVYGLECDCGLEALGNQSSYFITVPNSGPILKSIVIPPNDSSFVMSCCRFEFKDNSWNIVPMVKFFPNMSSMYVQCGPQRIPIVKS